MTFSRRRCLVTVVVVVVVPVGIILCHGLAPNVRKVRMPDTRDGTLHKVYSGYQRETGVKPPDTGQSSTTYF
jgi:signal transduction histidine kinase